MKVKLFYLGTSGSNPEEMYATLEGRVNKFIKDNNLDEFEIDTNMNGSHSPEYGFVNEVVITLKYRTL